MAIQIKKAVRERVWLKICTMGPAGAGKTYGSIALAKGIAPTGKVLVVDTENSSASYYADKWDFDVCEMHAPFTSQKYMDVLAEAVQLGYEVIVFDSLSHEWAASGGVLDKKADIDRSKGEKWGNWQDAKKPHTLFKEAWLQAPIHVVATMRSKMEYILEVNEKGKQVPRKVGLAPIQDGDSEYEYGVAFEIDRDSHLATAAKDRTGLFDGRSFSLGETIGRELAAWLATGAQVTAPAPEPATAQAPANPTPVPAPAAEVLKPSSQPVPAPTVRSKNTREKAAPVTSETWDAAMAELTFVTREMEPKSRNPLLKTWAAAGPAELPALLAEIATLKATLEPASIGAALLQIAVPSTTEIPAAVDSFVNGVQPDTDVAGGGIDDDQYEALNALIKAYGLNRDALRAYCVASGHLLPSRNSATLARMRAESFAKLRDRILNQKPHPEGGTWSERTIKIINATPVPAATVAA